MTDTLASTLSVPATPRPLSRRARRRAWAEAGVAVWWKLALIVLLVALFAGYGELDNALRQRRLTQSGVEVTGKVTRVAGVDKSQNANFGVYRDQKIPVEFEAILPGGRLATISGYLPRGVGRIDINQEMRLLVDPNDLTNWAEAGEVLPMWRVLAVPLLMMLPAALILLAIAWWRRRRVLEVWREGMRGEGVVVDVRQSATAPLSRLVRFALADGDDKRVFTTNFPSRAGVPPAGEPIALLYPADQPERAIVARLYTDGGN